jgi:hypothetical protein
MRARTVGVEHRRWGFFKQLLVAALDRAVALAQVQHRLAVGQHLDLDVADVAQVLFDVDRVVTERTLGLARRIGVLVGQFARLAHHAHAAPAAARRRLEQHRVADLRRHLHRFGGIAQLVRRAGRGRHAGLRRQLARAHLVAHL